jgi:PIN domain nuclease of toxin-antitoxin system
MPADTAALLLDTHVWVWFVAGDDTKLAPRVVSRIERAVLDRRCLVSVISVWEVAMLEAKGRLRLGGAVDAWVAASRRPPGVTMVELTPEIAIESTRRPGDAHGDPADRMLIATARITGAVLVTCDERIIQYAETGHLRVVDACLRSV